MSDRKKVYMKMEKSLQQKLKEVPSRFVSTLSMIVTGIVFARKVHFSSMSAEIPLEIQNTSIEKKIYRFFKNPKVDPRKIYEQTMMDLLRQNQGRIYYLVFDTSQVGNACRQHSISLVYQTRTIPLVWSVSSGVKGRQKASEQIKLLSYLKAYISQKEHVVFLGDGEYDSGQLITWFQNETNWDFVLSTSKSRLFEKGGFFQACEEYPLQKGKKKLLKNIKLKHEKCQRMNLLLWWGKKYEKPLYLLTSLTRIKEITASYKKRFLIETMFSDVKSKGFFLSKSRVQKTERMSRLLLAVAFAYIWTIDLGVRVLQTEQWEKIARNKRIDKSLFRLGLDWFTYLLKHKRPIPISFQVSRM